MTAKELMEKLAKDEHETVRWAIALAIIIVVCILHKQLLTEIAVTSDFVHLFFYDTAVEMPNGC